MMSHVSGPTFGAQSWKQNMLHGVSKTTQVFKSARCKTSWIESDRGESIATRNPCFAIRAEALNTDSYIFIQSVDVLQVRAQWGASSLPSQPAVSLFWCACAWKNLGNDACSDSFRMIIHSERVNCHSCLLLYATVLDRRMTPRIAFTLLQGQGWLGTNVWKVLAMLLCMPVTSFAPYPCNGMTEEFLSWFSSSFCW